MSKYDNEYYRKNRALILEQRRRRNLRNREARRAQQRLWYAENKNRMRDLRKKYKDKDPEGWAKKADELELRSRYNHPWRFSLYAARNRCSNPSHVGYSRYGGRGIKCLLTMKEIEFIWRRDRAESLKRPSLDRSDVNGDYTLANCSFIELAENIRKSCATGARKPRRGYDYEEILKTWG